MQKVCDMLDDIKDNTYVEKSIIIKIYANIYRKPLTDENKYEELDENAQSKIDHVIMNNPEKIINSTNNSNTNTNTNHSSNSSSNNTKNSTNENSSDSSWIFGLLFICLCIFLVITFWPIIVIGGILYIIYKMNK